MVRLDFDLLIARLSTPSLTTQKDESKRTPLLYALEDKHLWAIDTLFEKGTDSSHTKNESTTALNLSRSI